MLNCKSVENELSVGFVSLEKYEQMVLESFGTNKFALGKAL